MKTKKAKYIELEVIDWNTIFLSLIFYPLILFFGIIVFFFNFIRDNLKLLVYLFVSFIPIINTSLMSNHNDNDSIFDDYDSFFKEFDLSLLKKIKKFEVKDE